MKNLGLLQNFWFISAFLLVIFAKVDTLALGHRSAEETDGILDELQQVLKSSNISLFDVTAPNFRDDWPPSVAKHKAKLTRGFFDALLLAHFGREAAKAASHSLKTPFQDYFLPKNADAVVNVFSNVLGKAAETGNDKYISKIFFKCIDTDGDCDKNPGWAAYNKATSHGGAAESDIVICDHGWVAARELRFPKITCKEVGKQVSDVTMDSFGRMVLHEMLHHKAIGDDAAGVFVPIVDIEHGGHNFYGVCGTRNLLKSSPSQARINADSYAWMAQEYYWQLECGTEFQEPTCK